MSTILKIENLSRKFGRLQALDRVNLEIPEGRFFALLGPNGSGKSTLLKSILGSVPLEKEAQISLGGNVFAGSPEFKRDLVYMPQFPGFPSHVKVRELVDLIERLRGEKAVRKERLVQELGIANFWNRNFGELSGGMRQKINILQCLMFDFKIALLDEPTASLDPQISFYLKKILRELKNEGRTIVFTSHIMSEVEEMADRMVLLAEGRVYMQANPKEFIDASGATNLEEALLDFWREHAS